jgi:ABC-type transporter Mla subunit MlaD
MLKKIKSVIVILVLAGGAVMAQRPPATTRTKANAAQPDLQVKEYQFSPGNDKAMKVHVINTGAAASGLCVLRLTVRKINGVPVGRVTEVKLPPLGPGMDKWLVIDAKSILPNNISLESTTFRLNADASEIIAESNESNNELWHNL